MRERGNAAVAQSLAREAVPAPHMMPHDAVIAMKTRHPSAGRNVPAQNGRCGTGNFANAGGSISFLCERAKFRVLRTGCRILPQGGD